jgi:hypothetical protein
MDLTAGVHQAPLADISKEYTAFTSWMGNFQFDRVPFGLKGAPSYYQQQIQIEVLRGFMYKVCEAYIDDIITFGKTEEELKAQNIDYKVGKFSMMANSRARATFDEQGFVKILSCAKKDKILGAHIIAREAGNTIHEIVVAMEFGGSAEDIARTCHAHPTYNEAVKEACLAVDKRQIHS